MEGECTFWVAGRCKRGVAAVIRETVCVWLHDYSSGSGDISHSGFRGALMTRCRFAVPL